MKIGDEVYIHGYVDEIRQNVVIIKNDGGYFGTVAEEITNKSENPNTCGDAISRQAVLDAFWKLNVELSPTAIWTIQNMIKDVPSVTPQPTTGRWIAQDIHNCHTDFKCSECGYIYSFMHLYGKPTADYTYCPNCGTKMEVQE